MSNFATSAGLEGGGGSFSPPRKEAGETVFTPIDVSFARFLERVEGVGNRWLFVAALLVSRSVREGNVCLDLNDVTDRDLPRDYAEFFKGTTALRRLPDELKKISVVGKPGEHKPLILDETSRLYLYRYWKYEQNLSSFLIKKSGEKTAFQRFVTENYEERENLRQKLDSLFPPPDSVTAATGDDPVDMEPDWQKIAALSALFNNLTVISGGPGTGKTVTIARAIILLRQMSQGKLPRIAVAAPTGKAAMRLRDAIVQAGVAALGNDRQMMDVLPKKATTIHRLIGAIPHSSECRWNSRNPLPADIVVIDEASMLDLALMNKLISAIPEHARLILLGDREQLASVDAGAILGDICGERPLNDFSADFALLLSSVTKAAVGGSSSSPASSSPLRNGLIELRRNFRFAAASGISLLSQRIKNGDGTAALSVLKGKGDFSCGWLPVSPPEEMPYLIKDVMINFNEFLEHIDSKGEYLELFDVFDRFRILCALRHGPYGALEVNRLCEGFRCREISTAAHETFYQGRPVMITKNDYGLKLFNGDIGFILPDSDRDGALAAFFRAQDGRLRRFSPVSLPEHETAYAMTVHKSQGSEFDNVLLILGDKDKPVLTRELIYTAVTRAKKGIAICGAEDVFIRAVSRRIKRSSGLRDALRPTCCKDS